MFTINNKQLKKFIGARPWADPEKQREPAGNLYGMVFQNISIAAKSVCGEPEILWGGPDRLIYGLVFDNVTIGNDTVESTLLSSHITIFINMS